MKWYKLTILFADFTQNKTAAIRAKILSHAKFQLRFVAGCSEKNISVKSTNPPIPATPKSMVSKYLEGLTLFRFATCTKLTKIDIISRANAVIVGVKNDCSLGLFASLLTSNMTFDFSIKG